MLLPALLPLASRLGAVILSLIAIRSTASRYIYMFIATRRIGESSRVIIKDNYPNYFL